MAVVEESNAGPRVGPGAVASSGAGVPEDGGRRRGVEAGAAPLCFEPAAAQRAERVDWSLPRPLDARERRALARAHGRFAALLAEEVRAVVGAPALLEPEGLAEVPYFEFIGSLPNPTSLHHVCLLPQRASFVVEVSPGVLFPFLERLLGGRGDGAGPPARPLTRVEQGLARAIIEAVTRALETLWRPALERVGAASPRFDLAESEHNPLLMQIFGPTEPSLVLTLGSLEAQGAMPLAATSPLQGLDLALERGPGRLGSRVDPSIGAAPRATRHALRICWPARLFAPLLREVAASEEERAGAEGWPASGPGAADAHGRIGPIEVDVDVGPPEAAYALADILALRPGDLLETEMEPPGGLHIRVNGRPVAEGQWVEARGGGERAVRIVGTIDDGAREPPAAPPPAGEAPPDV